LNVMRKDGWERALPSGGSRVLYYVDVGLDAVIVMCR
jgi:hypothetical protein